jgi:hypothetical protein
MLYNFFSVEDHKRANDSTTIEAGNIKIGEVVVRRQTLCRLSLRSHVTCMSFTSQCYKCRH